jgi:hypothetical protein
MLFIPRKVFARKRSLRKETFCFLPRGTNRLYGTTYASFLVNPLLIVSIGARMGRRGLGHGRLTTRLIQVSTELNSSLECDGWHEVGQVFCLRRRVEYQLKCTQEYVYGITSLTPKRADPFRLLELIREHWSIENRLHSRRDVTLAEDACQVRKGTAPHALAVLNSFVLALFDLCRVTNAKQQMRRFDAQPLQAVQLLLKSLGEN